MAEATERGVGEDSAALSRRIAEKADKIKYLILAIVAITAAAIAVFSYQSRSAREKETAAENKVFQSVIDLQANPESDAIAAFGAAAKEYAGLPAGERALVFKYSYAFNTREFAAAEEAARDLLKGYPQSTLANRAKLGLGQALVMQNRDSEAITLFRELTAANDPEVMAETKLALAQTLEKEAEKVKDNPEQYRSALEAAEAEYNDIIARSQITVPSQRGFWPQAVTMPADFALVIIKDKLAGHVHSEPRGVAPPASPAEPVTQAELDSVMSIPPPAESETAPAETAGAAPPPVEAPAEAAEPEEESGTPAE